MERRVNVGLLLVSLVALALGTYMLVTGDWLLVRGNPSEAMARVGAGAIVFLGIVASCASLGLRPDVFDR